MTVHSIQCRGADTGARRTAGHRVVGHPLLPGRGIPVAGAHAPVTARTRESTAFNKLIDECVHDHCTVISFATAFRPILGDQSPAEREAYFAKTPNRKRSESK